MGAGRPGTGDRAGYNLPCSVSPSEPTAGAGSQESSTKHHAKLGRWGLPGAPSPTTPTCTLRFPAKKLPDTLAALPPCPPEEPPMLRSPVATWRGPGDSWADQGFLNPSGQWEGGVDGEGSWVFLCMIKWVCQAPRAGLGGKSGFWRCWGGGGGLARPRGTKGRSRGPGWEQMRRRPCSGQ